MGRSRCGTPRTGRPPRPLRSGGHPGPAPAGRGAGLATGSCAGSPRGRRRCASWHRSIWRFTPRSRRTVVPERLWTTAHTRTSDRSKAPRRSPIARRAPIEQLKDDLGYLQLGRAAECSATLAEEAKAKDWSHVEFLAKVIGEQARLDHQPAPGGTVALRPLPLSADDGASISSSSRAWIASSSPTWPPCASLQRTVPRSSSASPVAARRTWPWH